jgi:hypothetical protein
MNFRSSAQIYIHIVLDQRTDTLRTSIADAELENRDLVWGDASNLSTVMRYTINNLC